MDEAALGRFGDKRLTELGTTLLDAVQSKQTLCLHRLAESKRGKTKGTQVQHILTLNAEMAETCHRFDVMGRNYC